VVDERELIAWIAKRAEGVGDDCATLECAPWGTLLVTTDSVIDSVHLEWATHGPAAFGFKAIARGMSDVAAMGGEPLGAVLAVGLPAGVTEEEARALFLGAERAGCRIVGGDTASAPVAYATATVLGRAHAKGPVLRSGARVGDWIVVTGPLGGSLKSGRHVAFVPRVAEARGLMECCDLGAMIDVSDGLSTDLLHILDASRVGCLLEAERIPLNAGASLEAALNDGEDYELLATLRPSDLPAGVVRVGTITEAGAFLVLSGGARRPLVAKGYAHGA